MHADLRDADLSAADLQRANLSRARLDGADLSDADLRFSSLQGHRLRGADLRGARLDGTDLRQADLSGSLINAQEPRTEPLAWSHWHQPRPRSPASLHNAGVDEANAGRWPQAEQPVWRSHPGGSRSSHELDRQRDSAEEQQGNDAKAAQDLLHAADLLEEQGAVEQSEQVRRPSAKLRLKRNKSKSGNGVGSALLAGALSTLNAWLHLR